MMNSMLPPAHDRHLALAGGFQALEDLVFDLQVPGEVVFAGLQHRTRGRDGVAAALHFHGVEVRPVGHVVARIGLAAQHVTRLEIDELVRPGAHWLDVGRVLARLGAAVLGKQVLRHDHAHGADEGLGPEGRGLGEGDAHRVGVDLLDLDVAVDGHVDGGGGRVAAVLPVEDHVVGREGLAVVPGDALLELPGDHLAVGRQAAVVLGRNLGSERGHQVAFGVPAGQRLVKDARAFLFLGAAGEMRIQQHRALPPQQLQRAAAAAFGRLVGRHRGLCLGHAGMHQHHRGHRRRQAQADHLLDEAAPRQLARLDLVRSGP